MTGPVPADAAERPLADRVADVALAVPGVDALHAGTLGEVATYLPGRRVNGVRLRDDACEVHVVVAWGADVRGTARAVREAVRPVCGARVDVVVEDVRDPRSAGA